MQSMFRRSAVAARRFPSSSFSSTAAPSVFVEKAENGVATLVLARHEGKNAFSAKMIQEFAATVKGLAADGSIRCVVLRSDVPKVFCAGADLKERLVMPDNQVSDFVTTLRTTVSLVADLPVPTIAAIEGAAFGGGLELALACDMRVAGADALLGLTETALAIIPGAGGSQRLPRLVGMAKAKELIYTAARLNANDALAVGLVNHSVPSGQAVAKAMEIANSIAEKGPVAIRMAKKAIDSGMQVDLKQGLGVERACYDELVYTSDRKEGLNSFVEKRKPKYQGK